MTEREAELSTEVQRLRAWQLAASKLLREEREIMHMSGVDEFASDIALIDALLEQVPGE